MSASIQVVVLTYNSARDVDTCFGALARAGLPGEAAGVIAVDNGSHDETVRLLRERYPGVSVIENGRNLGFAGGNNVGIRAALERGAEWIYLLNSDAEVTPGFLDAALAAARGNPRAGAVQSLLLMGDRPGRINTAGNAIHFLGFGYCGLAGAPEEAAPQGPVEIAYASGAAVLLSAAALRDAGLFDEFLFLYHEDLDLGWRLRLAGYSSVLAPGSRVVHHYEFSRNKEKYYFMERNRYVVLLKNLSAQSLAVLAPLLFVSELGLFAVAAGAGWLPEKRRAAAEMLRPGTWRHIREARREAQARRRTSDREVASHFTAVIEFEGLPGGWVATALAQPMRLAWSLLRPLMSRRRAADHRRG